MYDVIVLGSGPAGLSAAVAARGRNKSVLVVGNRWQDSPLARAERVWFWQPDDTIRVLEDQAVTIDLS